MGGVAVQGHLALHIASHLSFSLPHYLYIRCLDGSTRVTITCEPRDLSSLSIHKAANHWALE